MIEFQRRNLFPLHVERAPAETNREALLLPVKLESEGVHD